MATVFIRNSEEYLKQIDEEVERLLNLRAQVAAIIKSGVALAKGSDGTRSEQARQHMEKARWAKKQADAKVVAKKHTSQRRTNRVGAKKTGLVKAANAK